MTPSRVPRAGWALFGNAWIDFYTAGDDGKGALGLTQAYLSAGRRWQDGSALDLVVSHLEFPQIERDEFPPVEDAQLADDHNERLALTGRLQERMDFSSMITVHAPHCASPQPNLGPLSCRSSRKT